MTNKIEIDIHPAPNWLTKEYLENVFKIYKKCANLKIKNLEIVPATGKGDNYSSIMTRIKLCFICDQDNDQDKIHNYIVKTSFEANKFINDLLKEYKTFDCEMNMYENVLPKLNEILQRINKDEFIFPETIYVDWQHTAIIMEDLSQKNYNTFDRIKRLDLDHAKCALSKMAKMHAASLVLNTELKNNYLKTFDRGIFNGHTKKLENFFIHFFEKSSEITCKMDGEYPVYGEKLKKLLPYVMERAEAAVYPSDNQFNVLNHGDFWTNNIMFRYNENGQIDNVLLIDFQYTKWTSPAWDLHYFFNTSLQEEQRYRGQDELFQYYHEILSETLKQLNFNGTIPDLYHFRLEMMEKEFLAVIVTLTCQVLLINEDTSEAEFDTLVRNDDKAKRFREVAFSNPRARQAIKNMLPIFNRRGLLDI